jgi:hypothetical protein
MFWKTKCPSSERLVYALLWYFFMSPCTQSGQCQDVFATLGRQWYRWESNIQMDRNRSTYCNGWTSGVLLPMRPFAAIILQYHKRRDISWVAESPSRWKENMQMDLYGNSLRNKFVCRQAELGGQWRVPMKTAINRAVPLKAGYFLKSWFSKDCASVGFVPIRITVGRKWEMFTLHTFHTPALYSLALGLVASKIIR